MIHLRHSAARLMIHRRRLHAAGSAAGALGVILCAAACARFIILPETGMGDPAALTAVPFTPAPEEAQEKPTLLQSPVQAYAPPPLPALPAAIPDFAPDFPEMPPAETYEADDILPETDAEALLQPPPAKPQSPPASPKPVPAHQKAAAAQTVDDFTPPAYLQNPRPPYPALLRRRRIQGEVGVLIEVDTAGRPAEVSISRSSGSAALDRHTRSWILRNWRFSPARKQGKTVTANVSSTLYYTLSQ